MTDAATRQVMETEDFAEGPRAFIEKREPVGRAADRSGALQSAMLCAWRNSLRDWMTSSSPRLTG